MRLTLCLLTWNELAGCQHDVPQLPLDAFDEVFAIDHDSTDGTIEYLQSRGITVHRQDLPTYNGAYLCGFRHCTTDALVLFHPKGSIDPAEVLKFRPLFEQGADLVIASRIGAGARNEEDDRTIKHRKWFVMGLGLIASILWRRGGPLAWDVLHGFRGMRKAAFEGIQPLPKGVSVDLEMVARSYKQRLNIVSFPVDEKPRLSGATHFKAWPTGKRLLKYLWSELGRPA
jgi:hypothetical protein